MGLETLGKYRVLEPIGSGGMSTVYAGVHTTLRRPVAIKVLHQQLVRDSVMARRMIGEAFTIAGLHHPGIVGVLDVGVSDDGRAYVVMERLIGEPLATRLRRGRLSEAKVLVFCRQIASALAATHAAGVIHRDLKPENLYVVPDPDVPGGERVKVLDFGIAVRDHDGRERTLTGVVLGTPAYMAPEQIDGSGGMDPRVDVFALGVVMYQMVTGKLPFGGANTEEMLVEQAFCAPTPAASLAPVSIALSTIIDRCLAKRPVDRFATMADLVAELGRCGLPIPAATSTFDSEDTNPDLPDPPDDEPIAAEAVSTRDLTARHVSKARARRWIAPVAVSAAVAVGILAAVVPRAAKTPRSATEANTGSVTETETVTETVTGSETARRDPPSVRRDPPSVRREPPSVRREPPVAGRDSVAALRKGRESPATARDSSSARREAAAERRGSRTARRESPSSRRSSSSSSSPSSSSSSPSSPSSSASPAPSSSPPPAGENRFAAVAPPTLY
jgi:serine/threonine-protein kinase